MFSNKIDILDRKFVLVFVMVMSVPISASRSWSLCSATLPTFRTNRGRHSSSVIFGSFHVLPLGSFYRVPGHTSPAGISLRMRVFDAIKPLYSGKR
jgi:hypothetical protein